MQVKKNQNKEKDLDNLKEKTNGDTWAQFWYYIPQSGKWKKYINWKKNRHQAD